MQAPLTVLLVGLLALAMSGCARFQRAEDAGAAKAHQLEEERVQKELREQDRVLAQILGQLKAEQQTLEAMQAREAAGETVPEEERVDAAKKLTRLGEKLADERKRHAELVQEAESLRISP